MEKLSVTHFAMNYKDHEVPVPPGYHLVRSGKIKLFDQVYNVATDHWDNANAPDSNCIGEDVKDMIGVIRIISPNNREKLIQDGIIFSQEDFTLSIDIDTYPPVRILRYFKGNQEILEGLQ